MAEIELDEQEYLIPLAAARYGWFKRKGHKAKVNGIEVSLTMDRDEKGCRCLVRISDLKSGMLLYKCLLDYFDLIKAKEKSGAMDIYKMALSDFAEFSKDKIETIKEQSAKWLDFMTETYEDMPEIVVWEGLESGVDEI